MIPTRGLTMRKVTDVRLALDQICTAEEIPTCMDAQIMDHYDITRSDVLRVCDIALDAVAEFRNAEQRAMQPEFRPEPAIRQQQAARPPEPSPTSGLPTVDALKSAGII